MAADGLTYTIVDTANMSTAEIYGKVLCDLAEKHKEIVGLSADLAKSTKMGQFAATFPDRFFNAGIAEQNMFGMAAGLAKAGLTPFVSTFAVFASLRAAEQVRTDICYQKLNVKIIATHAGTSFGQAGTTHHCTEDLAVMRSFANMVVIAPADGIETANAVMAAYEHKGPVYIRINRGFDPFLYEKSDYGFQIGKAVQLKDGTDITIIACGAAAYNAYHAANILEKEDKLSVRVINMHTIKPIDEEAILKAVMETRRIVTFEDHNIIGGLGSAVAEVIVKSGKGCAFETVGIPDQYAIIGLPEDLQNYYGFDQNKIIEKVRQIMGKDFEQTEDWEDEV